MKNKFIGNKDVDMMIMKILDDDSINSLSKTNVHLYNLCKILYKDDIFWENRLRSFVGDKIKNVKTYDKKKYKTYHDYYLQFLKGLYPTINIWMKNNKAVIICRYSRDVYQMISWDLNDDSFIRGQWLTKSKIKMDRCQFNKDIFSYFMFKFNPYTTYTVISRPPYFTALYIQYEDGTWTGSVNLTDNKIIINQGENINNRFPKNYILEYKDNNKINVTDTRFISNKITTNHDTKGRKIEVQNGRIYIDDKMVINFTFDKFRPIFSLE